MKTILVVEDNTENLQTAKAFFSEIFDSSFIYAVNKQSAENLLPTVDAVITDRSIPYRHNGEEEEIYGCHLAINAYMLGKPVVIASGHGDSNFFVLTIDPSYKFFEESKSEASRFFGKDLSGDEMEKELRIEALKNGIGLEDDYHRRIGFVNARPTKLAVKENISKKEKLAWKLAWKELLKQME